MTTCSGDIALFPCRPRLRFYLAAVDKIEYYVQGFFFFLGGGGGGGGMRLVGIHVHSYSNMSITPQRIRRFKLPVVFIK